MGNELIDFVEMGDERGSLISLEAVKNIPFEIKRVYYIYNTKLDVSRGFHAHLDLQQVLICVSGSCDVVLDDGEEKKSYHLDAPHKGLFVDTMIWREMHNFSENCVLLVLASDYYNKKVYIRDYDNFIRIRKG